MALGGENGGWFVAGVADMEAVSLTEGVGEICGRSFFSVCFDEVLF